MAIEQRKKIVRYMEASHELYLPTVRVMVARVFARKNNMTPTDRHAYYSTPEMFMPKYDEVHVSVTFTWDIARGLWLQKQWQMVCDNVSIGGPAFDDPGNNFTAGIYVRNGVTITSRGCPNNCSFCFVPKREGKIRELPIVAGNVVQDNNLLACSSTHIDRVFQMLSTQKHIDFSGGLEAARITDVIVDRLRGLKLYQLWLAFDTDGAENGLRRAVNKLSKHFTRNQMRCYVLIGYGDDTIEKAEQRLMRAWEIGVLPFAMLYQPMQEYKKYPSEWRRFQRTWTRPAAMKTRMRGIL